MIIVTGGSGFIGSALIAGLNAKGVKDILVVDILGKDERWKNFKLNAKKCKTEIRNKHTPKNSLEILTNVKDC